MDMKITFPGGKKVNADYKGFTINTDQSVNGGGEESAPEPFDLFLASLGTCAGIYVLGFCQKRNLNTEGLALTQSFHFNQEKRLVDEVNIKIHLPNMFPEKYKSALIKVAQLCTVKKHLESPPNFNVITD